VPFILVICICRLCYANPWSSKVFSLIFSPYYAFYLNLWPRCDLLTPSDPVRLRHALRGVVPAGAGAGADQQPVWDPRGRVEDHHAVPPHGAREGPGHRRLAAHPAGRGHPRRRHQRGCGLAGGHVTPRPSLPLSNFCRWTLLNSYDLVRI